MDKHNSTIMQLSKKTRARLVALFSLVLGVMIGGYLFSDTKPRSFLALHRCQNNCLQPKDLAGLIVSVGIQKFPSLIPSVVVETERTVVLEHPAPSARIHYLIFPKKDIKNIAEVSSSDSEYLIDTFNVIREIVREKNLTRYRVVTNGPGYQGVTYLHFHLIAE